MMKSAQRGRDILDVEVANVTPLGFWLLVGGRERFVPFKQFPWFREATISELTNVQLPSPNHLYWPALDIDLAVDSLDHPDRYPLVSRAHSDEGLRAAKVRTSSRERMARRVSETD